jgi:tetratricopeptide (TPR) repeat protein
MSQTKTKLFTLVLFLIPLLFILALEGALRLFNYGGSLDLFVLKKTGDYTEFVLNENFTKRYFFQKGVKTPVPLSQTFPAQKDSSTYRIFCLGASTTQGFPYPPNGAYPALLQDILAGLFPAKKVQVLNCGITAITSPSVLDMEREILRKYQPDLIVVYTGHNEFYGVFGQASTFSLFNNRALLQCFLQMQRSKLFLLMRNTLNDLFGKRIERGIHNQSNTLMSIMAKDVGIDLESRVFQNTEEQYQENLADMCRIAQKHHTNIMLCNLVDNEKDLPPFASKHRKDFAAQDTSDWHEVMKRAQNFQNAGQYQDAVHEYTNALKIDSTFALTHFQLGQCYNALSDYNNAKEHFALAKDYDTIRFRAPSSFNEIINKVAKSHHVPLIDDVNSFDQQSSGGIPGENLFFEHVHPKLPGYLLIARTIAEAMSQNGLISKNWDWSLNKADSTYLAMSHLTLLDHEVANYTIFRLMSQWPFPPKNAQAVYQRIGSERTEELAKSLVDGGKKSLVELHLEYGNEFHQKNEFENAAAEYQAALAIFPLATTYDRLGRLYLRKTEIAFRDRQDFNDAALSFNQGLYYFSEGLKRWPHDVEMNFNLGLLYVLRADETDAAVRQFLKVLELQPGNKNSYTLLTELYIRRHDYGNAKTYLNKAMQLFPEEARFCTDLGVVFLQENNLAEAEKWLDKAIRMNDDAKAKYYLNQVQTRMKEEKK